MYHQSKTRAHKKRKRHQGSTATDTTLGEDRRKTVKTRGGNTKARLVSAKSANVLISGKHVKCEVTWVKDNPASRDLTRRNIITKGALIQVKTPGGEMVEARVTSRPGQDGVINAVKL
jgi:small subunit ribosomal protein S8e